MANVFTFLNGQVLPLIYNEEQLQNLGYAFLLGVVIMCFSLAISIAYALFDKEEDKRIEYNRKIDL